MIRQNCDVHLDQEGGPYTNSINKKITLNVFEKKVKLSQPLKRVPKALANIVLYNTGVSL